MSDRDLEWRARWQRACERYRSETGEPYSAISKKAGLAVSYLSNAFTGDKTPGVDAFLRICNAIGVSPIQILLGLDWTREDERRIARFLRLPRARQERVLALLDDSD